MTQYSPTSAFWLFNRVAQFAYLRYNLLAPEIQKAAAEHELGAMKIIPTVDEEALRIYRTKPGEVKEYLTAWSEKFADRIEKVRSLMPDTFFGVDVITGCPGESDEDFEQTYSLLARLKPAFLHIFPFSERPGTPAVDMPNKVPSYISTQRVARLEELSDALHYEFCAQGVGKEMDVLLESTMRGGMMYGYTGNYIRVKAPYRRDLINRICRVRLTSIDENHDAMAEILE